MSLTTSEDLRAKAQVGTRYGVIHCARRKAWCVWDHHTRDVTGDCYPDRYRTSRKAAHRFAGRLQYAQMVKEAGDDRGV